MRRFGAWQRSGDLAVFITIAGERTVVIPTKQRRRNQVKTLVQTAE
jgi:hypothetical protein